MMGFACSKCGACCQRAGAVPEMRNYAREDGSCMYLTSDNECSIYAHRPDICRVDKMRPAGMRTERWYALNHKACEQLHLRIYGQELKR